MGNESESSELSGGGAPSARQPIDVTDSGVAAGLEYRGFFASLGVVVMLLSVVAGALLIVNTVLGLPSDVNQASTGVFNMTDNYSNGGSRLTDGNLALWISNTSNGVYTCVVTDRGGAQVPFNGPYVGSPVQSVGGFTLRSTFAAVAGESYSVSCQLIGYNPSFSLKVAPPLDLGRFKALLVLGAILLVPVPLIGGAMFGRNIFPEWRRRA